MRPHPVPGHRAVPERRMETRSGLSPQLPIHDRSSPSVSKIPKEDKPGEQTYGLSSRISKTHKFLFRRILYYRDRFSTRRFCDVARQRVVAGYRSFALDVGNCHPIWDYYRWDFFAPRAGQFYGQSTDRTNRHGGLRRRGLGLFLFPGRLYFHLIVSDAVYSYKGPQAYLQNPCLKLFIHATAKLAKEARTKLEPNGCRAMDWVPVDPKLPFVIVCHKGLVTQRDRSSSHW